MTAGLNWLISIGGSPVDALLMFFIVGILTMWWTQKRARDAEIKALTYWYTTLNAWAFGVDGHVKYNRLKSGNSQGDKELNWDGIPEKLMTVKMFKQWLSGVKKRGQKKQAASTSTEA